MRREFSRLVKTDCLKSTINVLPYEFLMIRAEAKREKKKEIEYPSYLFRHGMEAFTVAIFLGGKKLSWIYVCRFIPVRHLELTSLTIKRLLKLLN